MLPAYGSAVLAQRVPGRIGLLAIGADRLGRQLDRTELDHQTELVGIRPLFADLAVGDPKDARAAARCHAARRRLCRCYWGGLLADHDASDSLERLEQHQEQDRGEAKATKHHQDPRRVA